MLAIDGGCKRVSKSPWCSRSVLNTTPHLHCSTCPQPFTLPAYAGLTLGGILATSSHGTGDMKPSTLIDTILEAVWVDAKVGMCFAG
jgi:hypothetical protein